MSEKRFWVIQGYESLKLIFRHVAPFGSFRARQIESVMQQLAARHLEPAEIIAGHLLQVSIDDGHVAGRRIGRYTVSCGENPHYVASVWTAQELAALTPAPAPETAPRIDPASPAAPVWGSPK